MAPALMVLGEVAGVLGRFPDVRCQPEVECEDGVMTLSVKFPVPSLDNVELFNLLKFVVDVHQLRVLADRFNIPPAALEALLEKQD